jgi:hypothetical protein
VIYLSGGEPTSFFSITNVTGAVCARCEGFEMDASTGWAWNALVRAREGGGGRKWTQRARRTRLISSDEGMPEMPEISHTLSMAYISDYFFPFISLEEQDDISCISCIWSGEPCQRTLMDIVNGPRSRSTPTFAGH